MGNEKEIADTMVDFIGFNKVLIHGLIEVLLNKGVITKTELVAATQQRINEIEPDENDNLIERLTKILNDRYGE